MEQSKNKNIEQSKNKQTKFVIKFIEKSLIET